MVAMRSTIMMTRAMMRNGLLLRFCPIRLIIAAIAATTAEINKVRDIILQLK